MTTRLIDHNWKQHLINLASSNDSFLCICPFIKKSVISELLTSGFKDIKVITRLNLEDMLQGVSDIDAIRAVMDAGGQVRAVKGLHAKVYLFGENTSVITSANLTQSALTTNKEFGMISNETAIVEESKKYFHDLWDEIGRDVSREELGDAEVVLTKAKISRLGISKETLPDLGHKVGSLIHTSPKIDSVSLSQSEYYDVKKSFVTFFGKSDYRFTLENDIYKDIQESGSHWAATYPKSKRPRQHKDGDVMYIARMTKDPDDYRIYGVAFTLKHVDDRDSATENEIKVRDWKVDYPHYIRLYKGKFLAGTLQNGISLYEMMDELKHESFVSTQKNYDKGSGNTLPQKALMQKPDVKLTTKAHRWILQRLETNFEKYGTIPDVEIEKLDKPDIPLNLV